MAMMQCMSCGGVYETDQPGGYRYFHSCPPIALVTVDRGGIELEIAAALVQTGDVERRRRYVDRLDKRDENVRVTDYKADGTAIAAAKSEGKGSDKAV
jgi:hypothetical protein